MGSRLVGARGGSVRRIEQPEPPRPQLVERCSCALSVYLPADLLALLVDRWAMVGRLYYTDEAEFERPVTYRLAGAAAPLGRSAVAPRRATRGHAGGQHRLIGATWIPLSATAIEPSLTLGNVVTPEGHTPYPHNNTSLISIIV
jgi:hypothetical protein